MGKVIIFMFLLGGLLLVACDNSRPQISVETTTVLLGDVANGEIVTRDLLVRNEGQELLIVDTISTSCGCTEATLDAMTIPPGDSTTLHITFDSGAHGPELTGSLIRQVFIDSNDPEQPELILELAANILPPAAP